MNENVLLPSLGNLGLDTYQFHAPDVEGFVVKTRETPDEMYLSC